MELIKYLLSILFFLNLNYSIAAIEINAGEILTLGNINVTADINVNSGGTLIIDGELTLGNVSHTPRIYIKDGGKMISDNQGGSITGVFEGSYIGIIIEGTNLIDGNQDFALYLDGFNIVGARNAIQISYQVNETTGEFINQKIYVGNTHFTECALMVKNYGGGSGGPLNRDESINPITFESCTFISSEFPGNWPVHLSFIKNLSFINCFFEISGDIALHANQLRDATIKGCQFVNPNNQFTFSGPRSEMIFHRDNYNINIIDNIIYGNGKNIRTTGIGVGISSSHGNIFGGIIQNNTFYDCRVGISGGDAGSLIGFGGYPGFVSDANITANHFINNETGIQMSGSSNVQLNLNDFNSCDKGMLFNEELSVGYSNANTTVNCNEFYNCITSILVKDFNLTQFTPTWGQIDDNNKFYGAGIDILNDNNNQFTYNLVSTSYPGKVDYTQDVLIYTSAKKTTCRRRDSGEERNLGEASMELKSNSKNDVIEIYPNPSDGQFNILINSIAEGSRISVVDNLGRNIYLMEADNNTPQLLSLSSLSKGIYMVIIETNGRLLTERVVIN